MKKNQKSKSGKQQNSGQTKSKKKEPLWMWLGLGISIVIGITAYLYYQPPETLSASATPEQVALGEKLFAENCLSCHGQGARGENPAQSRGGQKADGSYLAPALNGTGHAWHHPNEMLFSTVKDGSIAKGSTMIGFSDRLSDAEIVAVLQYVKSLWPDEIQVRHAMRP
ncbi:MAG: cytochrome c [SAR324 cluster bacterium]|nr:cytochrome c [SAR324 cluster bacterium]MBL7034745.1 cytochrome c [SAR324 cluster bacterium]